MIYLIGQLWVWLLLTALSAGVAGWAFAAQRAAPAQRALRRDRENLLSDLIRLTGEDGGSSGAVENERETDATRRLLTIRDGRIAELERALDTARGHADDLAGELAELRRSGPGQDTDQAEELRRLRGLVADNESERARTIDVEPQPDPVAEENAALQLWRLRYFEQRVRYLETQPRAQPDMAPVAPVAPAADPLPEWRVRDAEARATYLEDALRAAQAPATPAEPAPEPAASPFAADAEVDVLLRWRLLYLERRVAHLQAAASRAPVAPMPALETAPDLDRWKWRARYLESRVRHLEQRQPIIVEAPRAVTGTTVEEEAPAPAPTRRGVKPPVLGSARNGAPDDFTLIDGVSLQQQSTLYSLGVFHFDQIAAWTPDHVTWVDNYLRLRGRIVDQEWLEQADDLAREGPAAARRISEEEAL